MTIISSLASECLHFYQLSSAIQFNIDIINLTFKCFVKYWLKLFGVNNLGVLSVPLISKKKYL